MCVHIYYVRMYMYCDCMCKLSHTWANDVRIDVRTLCYMHTHSGLTDTLLSAS